MSSLPETRAVRRPAQAANNVFWLVAERTAKAVGGVGIAVLIARHLGPDQYGRYGAAIGLSTLAKDAVMLGFDRIIRRDLAAHPEQAGSILTTSVSLGLAVAAFAILGLSAASGALVDDTLTRKLTLIVVWMALPQAFFSCEIWFESSGQTRPLVWTRNAVWITSLVVRLILIFIHGSVTSFAVTALAEWAVTYAAVCTLLRHLHGHEFRLAFDCNRLRAWFREGWPFVAMVIMASTADRTMVLVVHNLAATNEEAGYLNAALRITEIWWSISTIISAVLLPRIVNLRKTDSVRSERVVKLYSNASLLVGIGAAAAVTVTAPFIIPWVFGAAYRPSAIILVILFWSGVAFYPAVARSQLLVIHGQAILDLPSVATIAVLQISLAIALVPKYGAIGAATAITCAQCLGFYGMSLLLPKLRRASHYQFAAFSALTSPVETLRGLFGFIGAMIRKA